VSSDRHIACVIRRSLVEPSADRPSDLVLLHAGKGVSGIRSGVLVPDNGDAGINMVDF